MKSLTKLFRYGPGPSSSHTIAPALAARHFCRLLKNRPIEHVEVTLYDALAMTGKGHHTDDILRSTLAPYPSTIIFHPEIKTDHPLTMRFEAYQGNTVLEEKTYASLGGGEIYSNDDPEVNETDIYPFRSLNDIKAKMQEKGWNSLKDVALAYENETVEEELDTILKRMFDCVERGLMANGIIPANHNPALRWNRVAGQIEKSAENISDDDASREMRLTAYAYAVGESNASGEMIVTAPTCGSSGVLPAVLYESYHHDHIDWNTLRDSLYIAGIFGNLVKQNASIAGAIGGCQAEIGTASSMAAAALCYVHGLSLFQQEYAAECAMEHFLGLSCDPVDGYVMIPCIERNGMGALRAYDAYLYARYIAPIRKNQVSFDNVVSAMKLTGDSLASAYKETAEGGLAAILKKYENDSR